MPRINRFAAAAALAAALGLTAAPLSAAGLPLPSGPAKAQAWHQYGDSAEHGRHRRHRGNGIDGGDILTGILVLGGIAAVAGAIEKNDRERDYRDYPPPPPQGGYDERYEYRGSAEGAPSGLDRAADICVDAIERTSDPVGSVDGVRRGPSGWDVDGTLRDGSPFACRIGNDGAIEDIRIDRAYSGAAADVDGGGWNYDDDPAYEDQSYGDPSYDDPSYDDQSHDDGQWDDESYARARADLGQGG